jgi:hypothetical protein
MHDGNVDAPRQRGPGNERQRSHALNTGGAARCYNAEDCESGAVPGSTQMGNVGSR